MQAFLVGMQAMDMSITLVWQEGNPRQLITTAVQKIHRKALWACYYSRRTPNGQRSSVQGAGL
jgi:hypothetical protein